MPDIKSPRVIRTLWWSLLLNAGLLFSAEYSLRPGDVISVNVVDNPEFSVRSKIRPDGKINFPVLGDVEVAGLTSSRVVADLQEKLQPYVNNAILSVTIEQYFANKIFILGGLNSNGEFEIFEPVDIIRAIAMAGGLKNPKTKEGRIIKSTGEIIVVPIRKLFSSEGAGKDENFMLYPGDTFYVPKVFVIPWTAWHLIVATLTNTIALYLIILRLG